MATTKKVEGISKATRLKNDLTGLYQMVVTVALGIGTYILLTQDGKTYKVVGIIIGLECASRLYNAHVKN